MTWLKLFKSAYSAIANSYSRQAAKEWEAKRREDEKRADGIHYPYSDFLDALREKDSDLFFKLSMLTPSEFWQRWKEVYPEDFPHGGASIPHRISILPRPQTPDRHKAQ